MPAVVDAAISPDGKRIAILGGAQGQQTISIATLDQPTMPMLQLGSVEGRSVIWSGNDFVIATVEYFETIANENRQYSIERQLSITPDAKVAARLLQNGVAAGERFVTSTPVLRMTSDSPSRVMMVGLVESVRPSAGNDTRIARKGEGGAVRALWRVDPANGQGQLVTRGNFDTRTWSVDGRGEARVRTDVDERTGRVSLFGRAKGTDRWVPIFSDAPEGGNVRYLGYIDADDAVLVDDGGTVTHRRLADGVVTPFDVRAGEWLIWDKERGSVVGMGNEGERETYRWLDPEVGSAFGVLARAFKERRVQLWDWSRDRTRFVAKVSGPQAAPAWYLYDKTRKKVSVLANGYPELSGDGVALSPSEWRPYKARDGETIPAYLLLPEARTPGARLPLVVLPHDGPHDRDSYGFDFLAQFIASRGYAVLQPQYRGSSGFGKAFRDAGQGEWGGKIQTDILDGVAALAASGVIDPSRVCIAGWGFGGYSALAGAALHPGTYKCAASIAGYSNVGKILQDQVKLYAPESRVVEYWRRELGDPSIDDVAAASPERQAGSVQVPVLLIHGDKDTDVDVSHSRAMADSLKAAGKPYELIILEGENHYLTKAANRTRTLEALEQFLARYLPIN